MRSLLSIVKRGLIKGLRQRPGVWLPQSQTSRRFINKIKTPYRGYLERSFWKRSKGWKNLHLATTFNIIGIVLSVLRHCVPGNTCSGISHCDDWKTHDSPFVHSLTLLTKIQGHLTSIASLMQNARLLNGKLKGNKKQKWWPFWKKEFRNCA